MMERSRWNQYVRANTIFAALRGPHVPWLRNAVSSRNRVSRCLGFAALILGLGRGLAVAEEPERKGAVWPGMTATGAVVLPNGWTLQPAGKQGRLGDFPILIAEHPKQPILAVLHAGYGEHEVMTLDAQTGKTIGRVALKETFQGLVWSRDGRRLYVGGGYDDVIYGFDHADGLLTHQAIFKYPDAKRRVVAGLALSSDGKTLWVANAFSHSLARFDTAARRFVSELDLEPGSYPYNLLLDEDRERIYVSLWGKAQVAIIDTKHKDVLLGHYPTEEHPNEMVLAHKGQYLFVANANRNTVSVFDTEKGKSIEVIGTAIDPKAPSGSTPNALALSPDEKILFVANANTNNLAVVNVESPGASTPLGFIPTGWYPTCVRVARDGKTLWVANGKGASSKANRNGPRPGVVGGTDSSMREYIGGLFPGTLSILPMPTPKAMARYSKIVYACSPIRPGAPEAVAGPAPEEDNPIPKKVGDPSPITHCVYIIKENRTYDQVFGDMPEGNGDPELCLFPEKVTPNHHALARQFVLLDNFYVESEVSADGHEWSMGAYATDFVERTWPLGYRGDQRVPYPSEANSAVFAIAKPAAGYLWDRARAKGVSYRSYGEFVHHGKSPDEPATTTVEALQGHFDPKFRSFDLDYPDQKRADRFLEELAKFERTGEMPRLVILRLPNDHTSGTAPGKPTVTAAVADNDLALGRVVEGLSKSRFWPHLAIFVVEDDAQNGSDHVDAHRTVALVISPYTKRKSVDSTMYSTSSMLRTIELCLGLDPMSQFDASARPMYAAFTAQADPTPYEHRAAQVSLEERNSPRAPGAEVSARLNLEQEDRADDLIFNEIIWKAVRGADSPMPPPVRAAFVLPRPKREDDDD
jgi:DNA-binding beta-propeller fold protein YncE